MKLSSIAGIAVIVGLSACSTEPSQPVQERLDPDTATTVALLKHPVELVAASATQAANVNANNPFAFFAPFETNRMGKRALYLWMSVPTAEGVKPEQPTFLCDGSPALVEPISSDMSRLGLSKVPYDSPVPWNAVWYFQLPQNTMTCLAQAHEIVMETSDGGHFSVQDKGLTELRAFNSH